MHDLDLLPDEQGGDDQHDGQVDSQRCLKKEWFEEGCRVGYTQEEKGWQKGSQKLVGQHSLEYDLHF